MHYREIKYGFEWGSAKITRFFSDEKAGWVTLRIKTPKEDIQIYVAKTGKVKMYLKNGTEKK